MAPLRPAPRSVDDYIARCPPAARTRLQRIRRIVRRVAPEARETLSYRMPAFTLNGALVYFAAFTNHIGLFPPVRGDARVEKAIARFAGPKGNLRFPLDEPMPYALIERIVKLRAKQNLAKASAKAKVGRPRGTPY
ncbi:MAG TPA: DUF1801 domain-containing protein [Gemmatimonadaceae bacterium]|nr:DUF1801 domain-containing protein [Gemmatimonadaceae bacterium]